MKILLVDDSKTVRLLVQVYLMDLKPEFHEAGTGLEGLALARQVKPDLVIADVEMPGLDGFGLCQSIRETEELAGTPVLLLTTRQDEASRAKGLKAGCTAFLTKPIAPDQLRTQVRAALASPVPQPDARPGRSGKTR